jgi:diguanylate cyclase (GGDEF) domain
VTYSVIGILAIAVHLIINYDVFWKRNSGPASLAQKSYRNFLMAVLVYYVSDAIWGILYGIQAAKLLFADTMVYFIAMAASVLLWTQYVIAYLEEKSAFGSFLFHAGRIFFWFQMIGLIINLFYPVFFTVDETAAYQAGPLRYAALFLQIVMFLLTSAHTSFITAKMEGIAKRRYQTVEFFGIVMIFAIAAQTLYPLLPLYATGCLLGCCMLHTFVVGDEKEEYLKKLEEMVQIQQQQKAEIGSAKRLAYTDSLTGVKSKHAYIDMETDLDRRMNEGDIKEFAVASCDVNGLKIMNDTHGHKAGDALLCSACKLICVHFSHSPVFRIGGDEFEVILQGQDYENRYEILFAFNRIVEQNLAEGKPVVAVGIAEYIPGSDKSVQDVFVRADEKMYERKNILKSMGAGGR